jgi:transketolase
MVLTRQNVPVIDRERYASAEGLRRGGYVLADPADGDPEVILIATGSEVALALGAHEELIADGIRSRVVSLPCWEIFDRQDQSYRDRVLPPSIAARVSVEEASTFGWDRYVGPQGRRVGMSTFGSSAPLKDVMTKFGFSPDKVAQAAREVLE